MIKNYFKTAFRNLLKQKGFSFINIFGLAAGMAIVVLILLWTADELSYDKHHVKADRIYRIVEIQDNKGRNPLHVPYTMAPLSETLKDEFPVIEDSVRIKVMGEMPLVHGQITFYQKNVMMADPSIFNIFSLKWVKGTPAGALDRADTVVLSEKIASKFFGNQDPIGQEIILNKTPITVTGIIEDPPSQSHLVMDVIISFKTMDKIVEKYGYDPKVFFEDWNNNLLFTYVLLKPGVNPADVEAKIPAFLQKHKRVDDRISMYLQNLKDIYLRSGSIGFDGPWKMGNLNHVIIFFTIAIFILLIACINFTNLTTAKSTGRAREVGLRKVFGGSRSQLIFQFLSEAFVVTAIGMLIAVAMVELLLPTFNELSGKSLAISDISGWQLLIGFLGITFIVSLIAGSYPAFYLSKFLPSRVLKGNLSSGSKNPSLRKLLVVFQFSISIILMIGTWITFRQMQFLVNQELGFDKENIVVIENVNPENLPKMEALKRILASNNQIVSSTLCGQAPGEGDHGQYGMTPEGAEDTENWVVPIQSIDEDYIKTFDIQTVQGKPFSSEFLAEMKHGLLINETAARSFGWDNPIGKRIEIPSSDVPDGYGRVVGVVKDYYFKSLHEQVEPLVMFNSPLMFAELAVRIKPGQTRQTLNYLEDTWKQVTGGEPFKFHFLDDFIQNLYQNEARISKLSLIFSCLAILIASLGLLGLASYTTEQRTKEIGIRKILGASIPQVVFILTKDFSQWVLLSNIISWPISWYIMKNWLNSFPYRIDLSFSVFIATGIAALLIALLTISYQVIMTATANPVNALKYE